jgi:hypothetical protein
MISGMGRERQGWCYCEECGQDWNADATEECPYCDAWKNIARLRANEKALREFLETLASEFDLVSETAPGLCTFTTELVRELSAKIRQLLEETSGE